MKEIHLLPERLLKTPSVILLNSWYAQSFKEILEFEKNVADTVVLDRYKFKKKWKFIKLYVMLI